MTSPQAHFTLTLNNYDTEHKDLVWDGCPPHFTYFCYAREVCPETGTPHLQAYGQTKFQKSLSSVEKILNKKRQKGQRAWRVFDPVGNSQQNCDYVSGNCEKKGFKLQKVISYGEYRELAGRRVAIDGTAVKKVSWMETFVEWAEVYTFDQDRPKWEPNQIVEDLVRAYYGQEKKVFSKVQVNQCIFYYSEYAGRLYIPGAKREIAAYRVAKAEKDKKFVRPDGTKLIRLSDGSWKRVSKDFYKNDEEEE